MKKAGGLLGIVIVLAIGLYIYKTQVEHIAGGAPPQEIIDVTGVKGDLLSIGQAERTYLASHGSYGSLDQLQQEGSLTFPGSSHRGYTYSADVDGGQHFKITATPSDSAKAGWPTLTIDETMQVTQQ